MKCASCATVNDAGAKFCRECGAPLVPRCPRCQAPTPPLAKFCNNCGQGLAPAAVVPPPPPPDEDPLRRYIPPELLAKLEAARGGGGMRGERRVVTMLFCDVKGSTGAAERLDPEEWADIMNGAFSHLIAPVYRYEGTLARLMGDAILAFFGAPIAHEDDPQRAVLAALAILREITPYGDKVRRDFGIDFDVRVGINTGLVVVGEVGSDLRLEYTAMGDAVNLAARMEQTAEPGTLRVSEATFMQVAPLFDAEEIGAVEVKGRQEAVRAFRVIGAKARPGRLRGIEGLDSPMVGRARELAVLRGQAAALERGSGHVVSVMGEAGLGKSRLVSELRRALDAEGVATRISWHEGRTLSYQSAVPYAPVADLMRSVLGMAADASSDATYDRLRAAVGAALDEDRASALSPFLASLLGVALPAGSPDADRVRYLLPPALHAGIATAVLDLLAGVAAKRPLLIVLEDLHWADSASLQVIERLMPLADRIPLLLVVVLRPRPDEPSWRLHEVAARELAHRYTALALDALGEEDTRALVANLLHVEGLTASVRSLIIEKSEGNPYFVEEVIRSLIDQGVVVREGDDWRATREIERVAIPGSLAAVLSTRLDRLDEPSRRLTQVASVIGREFAFEVLAAVVGSVSEAALSELQRRGLVRERARLPRRRYAFKHVLVQEVAYESLLLKTRREVHRQVAEALARLEPEREADIARHYLEAREDDLALPHLIAGAERAARAYSTPEALRLFDRALQIIEASASVGPELVARVFEGRGAALALALNITGAAENWQAMIDWAGQHGDEAMRVSGLNKQAFLQGVMLGDEARGTALLDQAESAAEEVGCQAGLAEGCMVRCALKLGRADFEGANRYLGRATELGQAMNAEEPMLFGMTHVANTLVFMTEYDAARRQVEATLKKARELGNKRYEVEIHTFALPHCLLRDGDVEASLAAARHGVELGERIGDALHLCGGVAMLGRLAALQGRYEDAVAFGERAVQVGRSTGMPFMASMTLACLGGTLAEADEGLRARAQVIHQEAAELLRLPSGTFFGAECWADLGFVALEGGDLARARELFTQGLTVPTTMMHLSRPRLLVGMAEVALAEGKLAEAGASAEEVRRFVDERGMSHETPFVRLCQARVAAAAGDVERALALCEEARMAAERLAFRPVAARARAEAARLLRGTGAAQPAATELAAGLALVNEMAAPIQDESLRQGFLVTARKRLGLGGVGLAGAVPAPG